MKAGRDEPEAASTTARVEPTASITARASSTHASKVSSARSAGVAAPLGLLTGLVNGDERAASDIQNVHLAVAPHLVADVEASSSRVVGFGRLHRSVFCRIPCLGTVADRTRQADPRSPDG